MTKRKQLHIPEDKDSLILDFIEKLIRKIIQKLETEDYDVKVSDALRAIQLKEELKPAGEKERIFWELIEEIKKEELSGKIQS